MNNDKDKNENEIPYSAIMFELKQIHGVVTELKSNQKSILTELGGNGGPGIRTRLHSLETGYNHVVNKLDKMDNHFSLMCDEMDERVSEQEKRTIAMRNIGVGIVVGLTILEALRWIIPLFAHPTP